MRTGLVSSQQPLERVNIPLFHDQIVLIIELMISMN